MHFIQSLVIWACGRLNIHRNIRNSLYLKQIVFNHYRIFMLIEYILLNTIPNWSKYSCMIFKSFRLQLQSLTKWLYLIISKATYCSELYSSFLYLFALIRTRFNSAHLQWIILYCHFYFLGAKYSPHDYIFKYPKYEFLFEYKIFYIHTPLHVIHIIVIGNYIP